MSEAGVPGSTAIVTGASSQIGCFLLPRLVAAGYTVRALSRVRRTDVDGVHWCFGDLGDRVDWPVDTGGSVLFHLAHISLLPEQIDTLACSDVRRIVAFSSTGRFTKAHSGSSGERASAVSLACAEEAVIAKCDAAGIPWTLFRPTMIYGKGTDRNVSFIARVVKRCRFFPLAGKGTGLRQPVHAEDLASACLAVLDNPVTFAKSYVLSGGEILSYREMVERVFQGLDLEPRILTVPIPLLRCVINVMRILPGFREFTPEMASRMNTDLCFDHAEATNDFQFAPRERFVYTNG